VKNARTFVFFGEDAFSLAVLTSLVEHQTLVRPLAVVVLDPVNVSGQRLVTYCEHLSIPVIQTQTVRSEDFLIKFDEMNFDFIITAHFQRILPARIFKRARIGALNLHPSLLPKYRGMAPQHWPVLSGDVETGVTVHHIEEAVDTGRIIRQERISLDENIYIHELHLKFLVIYRTIMVEAIERLLSGERGEEQQEVGASYYGKIRDSDMELSVHMSVQQAYAKIRAFSFPYPGARFEDIRIMKAIPVDNWAFMELKKSTSSRGLHTCGGARYLILESGALELTKWRGV